MWVTLWFHCNTITWGNLFLRNIHLCDRGWTAAHLFVRARWVLLSWSPVENDCEVSLHSCRSVTSRPTFTKNMRIELSEGPIQVEESVGTRVCVEHRERWRIRRITGSSSQAVDTSSSSVYSSHLFGIIGTIKNSSISKQMCNLRHHNSKCVCWQQWCLPQTPLGLHCTAAEWPDLHVSCFMVVILLQIIKKNWDMGDPQLSSDNPQTRNCINHCWSSVLAIVELLMRGGESEAGRIYSLNVSNWKLLHWGKFSWYYVQRLRVKS